MAELMNRSNRGHVEQKCELALSYSDYTGELNLYRSRQFIRNTLTED